MNTLPARLLMAAALLFPLTAVLADTPPALDTPDTHSRIAKGRISLYRVQIQDMEFGRDQEKVDAEIFVTLDSDPDHVFTLRYHDDSPPVNALIADTLRDAYLQGKQVTLYHQMTPGQRRNVKILMVQMN